VGDVVLLCIDIILWLGGSAGASLCKVWSEDEYNMCFISCGMSCVCLYIV